MIHTLNKKQMKKHYTTLLLVCLILALNAQSIDSTFGNNGLTFTSFGPFTAQGECAALLSDGSIVTAGWNGNTTNAVLVAKYTADGLPDGTFNGTGTMQFSFGFTYEDANSIAELSSGNIVVGGSTFGNAALAVFNPAGIFDSSFNANGKLVINFGSGNGSRIDKVLQQPDGKIVAVGRAYNGINIDMMATRINMDGTLDSSFGFDGKMTMNIMGNNDFAYDAALQNDGKIVMAGYCNDNASLSHFCVARLNANGTVDNSFATGGVYTHTLSTVLNELDAVKIQPDGNIVVAGRTHTDKVVLRLTSLGIPDNAFGASGYVLINYNNNAARAYDLAIHADGTLLIAGETFSDTGVIHYAVSRLNIDGSPDTTFNTTGKALYPIGPGNSWAKQVMIQPDGRVLLFGQASLVPGGYGHFSLLRILQNSPLSNLISQPKTLQLLVAPNPTVNELYVMNAQHFYYRVYNFTGQLLLEGERVLGNAIDASALASGHYMLKIFTASESGCGRFTKR